MRVIIQGGVSILDEDFMTTFQAWCDQKKIIDKCQSGFWRCYENYKTNHPERFLEVFQSNNREHVSIVLDKTMFCINYTRYEKPTIEVDFHMLINKKYIGWYRQIFFTNGDFADEFFVFE